MQAVAKFQHKRELPTKTAAMVALIKWALANHPKRKEKAA